MNNIIKNILVVDLIFISCIIGSVVELIKRWANFKVRIISAVGAIVFIIAGIWINIPYLKDLMRKETIMFEGTFLYDDSGADFVTDTYYFDTDNNGKRDDYFVKSIFSGSKYVPKKGKRYRVVVYKHSHTIYSLELLE